MKILIAEDDVFIREGLQILLEEEGYVISLAKDGKDALNMFKEAQPDFVLLDIMMPEMDGYAVCREIRRHNASIPVVFISAKSEEIDRVVGLELGADDYIMKPFGTREVVARIRAVTRRCLAQQTLQTDAVDFFDMHGVQIYPKELRAKRGNQSVELSLRDVNILKCLYDNQGKVVDRDMLFDYAWGRNYLPSSRTLDQHISKLRKLIELDSKNPSIIQTVHGVGYRFDK